MSRLFEAYRALHEQAFMPIFVQDDFDSRKLVEACVAAGYRGIEYTLRRQDAREMIPWVRKNYPDLYLVCGSTIDDEKIVRQMQRKHPQLMTVAEVADLGVDGFVSMLGWTEATIRKYAPTHLIMPTASTVTEGFYQTTWGAHFQKINGATNLTLVNRLRSAATFDFCPVLVTGGQTLEQIPKSIETGAVMIATGFDLMLKGQSKDMSVEQIADVLKQFQQTTANAQQNTYPELAAAEGKDNQTWLDALPHWHPF